MKNSVKELMTQHPAFCTPDTPVGDVAMLMVQHDCGEIPVVDHPDARRPVGVVTDRDIVCRLIARGRNPLTSRAEDCMSQPVVTVTEDTPVREAVTIMEKHQVRRLPVVDQQGQCVGMIAQADIAWAGEEREVATLVREVSRDTGRESR